MKFEPIFKVQLVVIACFVLAGLLQFGMFQFIPQPYARGLAAWSMFGFLAAGLLSSALRFDWTAIFWGPLVALTCFFVWLSAKWSVTRNLFKS